MRQNSGGGVFYWRKGTRKSGEGRGEGGDRPPGTGVAEVEGGTEGGGREGWRAAHRQRQREKEREARGAGPFYFF